MSIWKLSDQALVATARTRRQSLVLRLVFCAAFALSVGLTTGSYILPVSWFPFIAPLLVADAFVGQAFLEAAGQRRRELKGLFVIISVASMATYMGMAVSGAALDGGGARLVAVFMAADALITTILLMVEAPLFMAACALPPLLTLGCIPFLGQAPEHTGSAVTAGLLIALVAFVAPVVRMALAHTTMLDHLKTAHAEAERRREEAEARSREAEAQRCEAVRANRAKSEFLCTMTHELRTPLNAIINYSEMIEEECEGAVAGDAQRVTRSARHLLSLIERILDFSDVEAGKTVLQIAPFKLADAITEVVAANLDTARAAGNTIVFDAAGADFAMTGDRTRVMQCVDCLMSNAAKFTRDGRIEIEVTRAGGDLRVAVTDTGIGINAETMARMFEAFVQSDGSKTRTAQGLGLGLANARRLARAMGGDIVVTSQPGSGSRFEFTAPLALETPVAQAA